jgi:hypothetical protein
VRELEQAARRIIIKCHYHGDEIKTALTLSEQLQNGIANGSLDAETAPYYMSVTAATKRWRGGPMWTVEQQKQIFRNFEIERMYEGTVN